MARADTKPKLKRKTLTQKEQSERFRETARKLGCDESEGALERAFEKIVPQKRGKLSREERTAIAKNAEASALDKSDV